MNITEEMKRVVKAAQQLLTGQDYEIADDAGVDAEPGGYWIQAKFYISKEEVDWVLARMKRRGGNGL